MLVKRYYHGLVFELLRFAHEEMVVGVRSGRIFHFTDKYMCM